MASRVGTAVAARTGWLAYRVCFSGQNDQELVLLRFTPFDADPEAHAKVML